MRLADAWVLFIPMSWQLDPGPVGSWREFWEGDLSLYECLVPVCRKPGSVNSIRRPWSVPGVNLPAGRGAQSVCPVTKLRGGGVGAGREAFASGCCEQRQQRLVDVPGDGAKPKRVFVSVLPPRNLRG